MPSLFTPIARLIVLTDVLLAEAPGLKFQFIQFEETPTLAHRSTLHRIFRFYIGEAHGTSPVTDIIKLQHVMNSGVWLGLRDSGLRP